MSWLINKLTGSTRKAPAPEPDSQESTPTKPSKPSFDAVSPPRPGIDFAPPRPDDEPSFEWPLPAGTLGSGSEVARAVVSLYMQQAGHGLELKFKSALLVLIKAAPFAYEFKIVSKDKVLISQPLTPSLAFFFKPVRNRGDRQRQRGDSHKRTG